MIVHALRGCGADPGLPDRRRAALDRPNAAWGAGEWLVVEADESDRSFLKLRPRGGGAHQRRARPPRDLRARARSSTRRARVPRARAAARWSGTAAGAAGAARPCAPSTTAPSTSATPSWRPTASRFRWRGQEVRLAVPGAHNVLNAPRRSRPACSRARDPAGAAAALADFPGAGRRFEHVGRTASGARGLRRLRPPPDRGARDDRGGAHAAPAPGRRRASSRTSTRAPRCSHRDFGAALALADLRRRCSTSTARASARRTIPGVTGKLVADAAADAAGGRPGRVAADAATTRSACCARSCGRATSS